MKKVSLIVVAVVLVALALTACGGTTATKAFGHDDYGYVNVPTNWIGSEDPATLGQDLLQTTNAKQTAYISMGIIPMDSPEASAELGLDLELVTQTLQESFETDNVTGIVVGDSTIAGLTCKTLVGVYTENDKEYTMRCWITQDEGGSYRVISAEAPTAEIETVAGYIASYALTKPAA